MKTYRYYDLILGAYVCVLLCANLIGAAKETTVHVPVIGSVTFLTGVLFFPISYLFGDILTEVYGYARDRRVVWSGFAALVFAAVMAFVIVHLPASDFYRSQQPAVEAIFGNTPRIVTASIIAFWCGSFVNSYVLAKMKIWTSGRWLWTRIVGSTLCGELVASALFYTIAFAGLWPTQPGGHDQPVHLEVGLVGDRDSAHLPDRRFPEARRTGGLLRPQHGLHAVLARGLRQAAGAPRATLPPAGQWRCYLPICLLT